MIILQCLFCMLEGYLIGTLNPSYWIARLRGFDIRESGSGNAGASNAVITMGKAVGLFAAFFDIAKAFGAVRLAQFLFTRLTYAGELAGISVILGHIFPFTMGFRGGKGLASLGGVIWAFSGKIFCIMLLAEIVLALVTDYICVVPITASIAFPVVYYFFTRQVFGTILYALMIPIFLMKHMENLKRIAAGTELHFSYLWRKDQEIQRVRDNMGEN